MKSRRRRAAFTLIELLAALFVTALVTAGAAAFYLQLSEATRGAVRKTAEGRHAVAILDRVARDLEGAFLLTKPETEDRLSHPWIFTAEERRSTEGADQLRFSVRNHLPTRTDAPGSNLAIVTYALRPQAEEGFELLRWVRPGLPLQLEREAPDEAEAVVLAENVGHFAARFLTAEGEWVGEWDSTGLVSPDSLPVAAEIEVALLEAEPGELEDVWVMGPRFRRGVLLPNRPFDLAQAIATAAGGGTGDEGDGEDGEGEEGDEDDPNADSPGDCPNGTVQQCIQRAATRAGDLGFDPVALGQSLFGGQLDNCAPPSLSAGGFEIPCN